MRPDTLEDEPPQAPAAAPWPLTEEHRRAAAQVAAWAIEHVRDRVAELQRDPGARALPGVWADWLDLADRADRLSRGWRP